MTSQLYKYFLYCLALTSMCACSNVVHNKSVHNKSASTKLANTQLVESFKRNTGVKSHIGTSGSASPELESENGDLPPKNSFWPSSLKGLAKSTGHSSEIRGLFYLPEQGQLVSIDREGLVLIWERLASGEAQQPLVLYENPKDIEHMALSREHGLVAFSQVGQILIIQVAAAGSGPLQPKFTLERLPTAVTSLDFHPDGQSLFIGGADGRVYRWRYVLEQNATLIKERERVLERYIGPASVVSEVAAHSSGRFFLSGDWRGGLYAWLNHDADRFGGYYDRSLSGERVFTSQAVRLKQTTGASAVEELVFTEDGKFFFAGLQNGTIQLWQVRGFKKLAEVPGHKGLIYSMTVDRDQRYLCSSGRDGKLRLWEVETEEELEGDPLTYELKMVGELSVSALAYLEFGESTQVFAGNSKGEILEIALEEMIEAARLMELEEGKQVDTEEPHGRKKNRN